MLYYSDEKKIKAMKFTNKDKIIAPPARALIKQLMELPTQYPFHVEKIIAFLEIAYALESNLNEQDKKSLYEIVDWVLQRCPNFPTYSCEKSSEFLLMSLFKKTFLDLRCSKKQAVSRLYLFPQILDTAFQIAHKFESLQYKNDTLSTPYSIFISELLIIGYWLGNFKNHVGEYLKKLDDLMELSKFTIQHHLPEQYTYKFAYCFYVLESLTKEEKEIASKLFFKWLDKIKNELKEDTQRYLCNYIVLKLEAMRRGLLEADTEAENELISQIDKIQNKALMKLLSNRIKLINTKDECLYIDYLIELEASFPDLCELIFKDKFEEDAFVEILKLFLSTPLMEDNPKILKIQRNLFFGFLVKLEKLAREGLSQDDILSRVIVYKLFASTLAAHAKRPGFLVFPFFLEDDKETRPYFNKLDNYTQ